MWSKKPAGARHPRRNNFTAGEVGGRFLVASKKFRFEDWKIAALSYFSPNPFHKYLSSKRDS